MPAMAPGLRPFDGDGDGEDDTIPELAGELAMELDDDEEVEDDIDSLRVPKAVETGSRRTVGEYPEY